MDKRIKAAIAAAFTTGAVIQFTAWDVSPAQWDPALRFTAAIVVLFVTGLTASCPLFDED